jgi:hypothetical protein
VSAFQNRAEWRVVEEDQRARGEIKAGLLGGSA